VAHHAARRATTAGRSERLQKREPVPVSVSPEGASSTKTRIQARKYCLPRQAIVFNTLHLMRRTEADLIRRTRRVVIATVALLACALVGSVVWWRLQLPVLLDSRLPNTSDLQLCRMMAAHYLAKLGAEAESAPTFWRIVENPTEDP